MVDYDEFGDEEFADMYSEVETMVEEAEVSLKVGDKVTGTIYEVDEDGAYCEVGSKYSGFVPLSECSFVKLKTVRLEVACMGAPPRASAPRAMSPCPCPHHRSPLRFCAWA